MNWIKEAEKDLRTYESRISSQENIKNKIVSLNETMKSIKGATPNAVAVKGGMSRYEDKLINCMVEITRLKHNYRAVSGIIAITEKGLNALSDEERMILTHYYINGRNMEELREKLGYEKSSLYRLKDKAIYKFTINCYGIIDL